MLKLGIQKDSTSNQYKYLWKISNYKLKQEVLPTLFRISPLYTKFSGAAKSVYCHCQIMYKEDFVNNLKTACGKLITHINSMTKHTLFFLTILRKKVGTIFSHQQLFPNLSRKNCLGGRNLVFKVKIFTSEKEKSKIRSSQKLIWIFWNFFNRVFLFDHR